MRMKRLIVLFSMVVAVANLSFPVVADTLRNAVYTPEDREIFDRYLAYIEPWQSAHTDTLLEKTALFFLDRPYVSHTLEMDGEEKLVVNLREFDCTTFVESVIALVRTVYSGDADFETFLQELQYIRYRDGDLRGYASRLHYTSDWLYDNEKKKLLKNSAACLGGIREQKRIDFMTTHRSAYRQLKNNDDLLKEMQKIEEDVNKRKGFYYLPKGNISVRESMIPHMSVVAFTTSIKGLDVTHMGFAFRTGDRLTFIHASSAQKKVVIDQDTLSDYCTTRSSCTGIIVLELKG